MLRIRIAFVAVFFALSSLSACAQYTAGLTVPALQTFLLGEYTDKAYRVKLDNRGQQDVTVRIVEKTSRDIVQKALLAVGEKANFDVEDDQEVTIENATRSDAEIFVRMSRKVQGMRYVNMDGTELDKSPAVQSIKATPPEAPADGPAVWLASGPKSTQPVSGRLSARLEKGQRLIIGEGSDGGYSVRIRTNGSEIKVSGRDAKTGEQTQGFGLSGRETIYLREGEILYLDAAQGAAQVTVLVEESVLGQRVMSMR